MLSGSLESVGCPSSRILLVQDQPGDIKTLGGASSSSKPCCYGRPCILLLSVCWYASTYAAILLIALLAGLSVAHAKVVVQKIDPSSELSDLDTADVDGDATFSPPQLKYKKPEKDIIELAPLPEINPVDKVKSLLAPVVSEVFPPPAVPTAVSGVPTTISGAPVAISGAPIPTVPALKKVDLKKGLLKKKPLLEKDLTVPVYDFDFAKDKKSKKGDRKML